MWLVVTRGPIGISASRPLIAGAGLAVDIAAEEQNAIVD
jgi:hypothetical protein